MRGIRRALGLALMAAAITAIAQEVGTGWPSYGGDAGGTRYSRLTQITPHNVGWLAIAWEYHTGDVSDGSGTTSATSFHASPILFDHTLYLSSPFDRVIALEPGTGKPRWTFDPTVDLRKNNATRKTDGAPLRCRGVAAWADTRATPGAACAKRIFEGVIDGRLIALDATTGKPCADFGKDGTVAIDLATGAIRWRVPLGQVKKGPFYTLERWGSPNIGGPIVTAGGLVFIGATMDKKVRAFDAKTGAKVWETGVPAFAMATPMTYAVGGRQYGVIAAGGHGAPGGWGDSLIAFALPAAP